MDDEAEHERAGLRRDHVQPGRLRDYGAVRRVPAQERRERAGAAVLLADHAGDTHATAQKEARVADRLDGEESAAEAALHVDGAAAVDAAVADDRVPGRRRPGGRIADGDHIDVAVQEQVAAGTAAFGGPTGRRLPVPADDAKGVGAVHLVAPVRVPSELLEVDLPLVGLEPGLAHPRRYTTLGRGLLAVEAWDSDQLPQERDQAIQVQRLQRGAFVATQLTAHSGVTPGRAAPAASGRSARPRP